jgi:hypothetical protein
MLTLSGHSIFFEIFEDYTARIPRLATVSIHGEVVNSVLRTAMPSALASVDCHTGLKKAMW